MKRKKTVALLLLAVILLCTPITRFDRNSAAFKVSARDTRAVADSGVTDISPETVPLSGASAAFAIPVPVAAGRRVVKNERAEIDVSNVQDGYVMVRYRQAVFKEIRVIVQGPGQSPYIYRLRPDGEYAVFPLSDGNGHYRITVYENVFDNKYSTVLSTVLDIRLSGEFAPFIRPNQYVNYHGGSETTRKATELTAGLTATTDKIAAIYHYVSQNISYDRELADAIESGYIPDVDKVLQKGRGICFDYAAVMTAMLRSQGIPAKLVIGYKGNAYHAWISAYSDEAGWVDGIIYFDGTHWKLMDPTLASNSDGGGTKKETGDGAGYAARYFY